MVQARGRLLFALPHRPGDGRNRHLGERRRQHLKNHQSGIYTGMLLTGKLEAHLREVAQQAEEMYSRLVEKMAEYEGITEALKAADQMAWVQQMNNICNRAAEIVREELIYA